MRSITYGLTLFLIFTIPFKEIFIVPGVGSISRLVGAIVIGFWLFTILATGKFRKPTPFLVAALLFFLWNIASLLWSLESESTMSRALAYARMAFLAWLIWDLFTARVRILRGLQAYVLGCWVSIGSILFNFINGVEAYQYANSRVTATNFDANEIGIILAFGLPIAWYLCIAKGYNLSEKSRTIPAFGNAVRDFSGQAYRSHSFALLRYLNYVYIPAAIFAIFLTASRGSILAMSPALIYIICTVNRLGPFRRIVFSVLTIAALFVLQDFIPQESIDRISTTGQELASFDLNGRIEIWRDGFRLFTDHLFIGTGAGTFANVIKSGKAPHNTALALLTDVGIIGFLLFYLTFILCAINIVRVNRDESWMWLTFLLIWTLGSLVSNWEHKNLSWLLFSMLVAGANITRDQNSPFVSSSYSQ